MREMEWERRELGERLMARLKGREVAAALLAQEVGVERGEVTYTLEWLRRLKSVYRRQIESGRWVWGVGAGGG